MIDATVVMRNGRQRVRLNPQAVMYHQAASSKANLAKMTEPGGKPPEAVYRLTMVNGDIWLADAETVRQIEKAI